MTTRTAPSTTDYPARSRLDSEIPAFRPAGLRQMTHSLTIPGEGPNRPQVSRWIPLPDVPAYPVFSGSTLRPARARSYPAVSDVGPGVQVSLARYAIALAFADLGLREGDRVLLPA